MTTRLIVCADGTWNTPDKKEGGAPAHTNVEKIRRLVRKPTATDGSPQYVHYQVGVGTDAGIGKILGGAFGRGIDRNIIACYRFLVDNYVPGAEIFLFGFSRGAYTVRSLAGLIRNSGLLKQEHAGKVLDAYKLYRDRSEGTHPTSRAAEEFRAAHAWTVRLKFVGVWDTVGSLGVPVGLFKRLLTRKYQFHDVTLSSWIDNAFHALAIDERRKPFAPTLWEPQGDPNQRVEQAWFAGVHSNVGGGYPDCGLSDVALQWMVEKARSCGLEFDDELLRRELKSSCEGRLYESLSPWYKVLGVHERTIGKERRDADGKLIDTRERVHDSVFERQIKVTMPPAGPYAPRNLRDYLRRTQQQRSQPPADRPVPV